METRLEASGRKLERKNLQEFSDRLDEETSHRWVFDDVIAHLGKSPTQRVIVDAIRKPQQIKMFRDHFSWRVTPSTTRRPRRFGEFDWTLLRRSCALNAPTDIAFTFADYIKVQNRRAFRFEQLTRDTIEFIEEDRKSCSSAGFADQLPF